MGNIVLFLIRCFIFFYCKLPRRVQLQMGNLLGAFLRAAGFRHSAVEQNLRLAFPGDVQKQKKIDRQSYLHLGNLILEAAMVLGGMKEFVQRFVDLSGLENLVEAKKRGKGIIVLSSHLGNWEIMAATGGVMTPEDLVLVTKRLKPNWFHDAIEKGRAHYRVRATYEPKTVRDILSHLKRNGMIGFVLDQYSGPPVGVRVPLFGVPVGTSLAVAAMAKRTGAAVVPVENFRKSDGRWAVIIHPIMEWKTFSNTDLTSAHYELAANTAEYTRSLEKNIYSHPDQWLWTHRRFKGDLSPLREGEWNEPRVRK